MNIGLAADHGGFSLKECVKSRLQKEGHEVRDFGAFELNNGDDYPDFVIPLAKAIARNELDRGIAVCGSGVGASIAANKIPGVRAAPIHEGFSARQGVEDDDMNIICLGGRVTGDQFAFELIDIFLKARFTGAERHQRRLGKIKEIENKTIEESL
jgi:ribose 5-phosphate isomerase B